MSTTQDSKDRTLKAKKAAANPPPITNPGHSGPTTFFLKSEREVARAERGRSLSRESGAEGAGMASSSVEDSSYGVQSLEDAMSASYADNGASLSRTNSNATDENTMPGAAEGSTIAGRKRKAGNPVHPRIAAAGQRIISSEYQPSTYASAAGSPVSLRSAESPFRTHLRRGSATSSINLSQPLTPLKGSPRHEGSAPPGTPRSGSPKSFRLSDEEVSVASDTGSQAVASSSGEDDEDGEVAVPAAMPQLVMPSIAMPARRPFTERGRRMGRLRVMVVGPRGVGKTSLVQSLCRTCEDVVHLDPVTGGSTQRVQEIGASTKPYPSWRSDVETSQRLRRASASEGVLERNLVFVDTPGLEDDSAAQTIRHYVQIHFQRMLDIRRLPDNEALSLLSGEGGSQIDAVLYLCDPARLQLDDRETALLADLAKWTNVIPLLGRSDTILADELAAVKERLQSQLAPFDLHSRGHPLHQSSPGPANLQASESNGSHPLAVSSALEDDSQVMDASVLMSSTYLAPLLPSELALLTHQLLNPDTIARLRHLSAHKFLLWRQDRLVQQTLLTGPSASPGLTGTDGSLLHHLEGDNDGPSKVLVPHASSSYYRSVSPSGASSDSPLWGPPTTFVADPPFRQVRLAKWAQDLRRSLEHERTRYQALYTATSPQSPAGKQRQDTTSRSLVPTTRPPKGRLGGDLAVIDPRDPLGLLALGHAFRRRGRLVAGCGIVSAALWWVVRHWVEVQEWFGGAPAGQVSLVAVPAPTTALRGWEGWARDAIGL